MIKRRTTFSINVISVLIILMCFCIGVVGYTNSWFSAEQNNVQIVVDVGDLKLKVYQGNNEIYTYDQNLKETNKSYVNLSGKIIPNQKVPLALTLKNEDLGSTSMYVRFRFDLYARGVNSDTLIPTTIEGFIQPTQSASGFVKNTSDGYYYYKDINGNLSYLAKGTNNATLMDGFTVDYSSFINTNYDRINTASSVYIKLTVQASVNTW